MAGLGKLITKTGVLRRGRAVLRRTVKGFNGKRLDRLGAHELKRMPRETTRRIMHKIDKHVDALARLDNDVQ